MSGSGNEKSERRDGGRRPGKGSTDGSPPAGGVPDDRPRDASPERTGDAAAAGVPVARAPAAGNSTRATARRAPPPDGVTGAFRNASRSAYRGASRGVARGLSRFGGTADGALWYALLVVVLPTVCLLVVALITLWQEGRLIPLLVGWLAVTLFAYLVFVNLPGRRLRRRLAERTKAAAAGASEEDEGDLPEQLAERPDWSERDSGIWQRRCLAIERTLAADPDWERLPELAADELSAVAAEYHGPKSHARFRFTLPELLQVVSVASDRYRGVVMGHVPFADRITVASLMALRDRKDQISGSLTWLNRARRVVRLSNPIGAAVGEIRDQFTNRVFDETSESLQQDLKRLVLQEIAQVGIDLYSGRLKVSDTELADYRSRAAREDETRTPEAAEPLRVVLLGQISAGKSSLVNALAETLEAEVDQLPSTERLTVHALHTAEGAVLHLVDTPGIDEDPERRRRLVKAAAEADLLLWVARANQPARAPDEALHAALDAHFDARPERRMPPALLVLTHIDRLPPRAEWSPPYDLERGSGKADTIRRALVSAREAIGFEAEAPMVPVSLAAPAGGESSLYNVDAIAAQVMMLADEATLAQFNRRRVERGADSGGWRTRWRQARGLGMTVGRSLARQLEQADGEEGKR